MLDRVSHASSWSARIPGGKARSCLPAPAEVHFLGHISAASAGRAWGVLRLKTKGYQVAQVASCINNQVLWEIKVCFFLK